MSKTPPPPEVAPDSIFYQTLGKAISLWQYVERDLCLVFEVIAQCRNEPVARAIFYTPKDFSTKLDIVHHVARIFLPGSEKTGLKGEWFALRRRLRDASEVRNCLAHFQFITKGEIQPTPQANWGNVPIYGVDISYWLTPNYEDPNYEFTKSGQNGTKRPLDHAGLTEAHARFLQLTADLKEITQKIRGGSAPAPKSSA